MLRVGVIGCGPVGHIHAQAYKDSPDADLVAVCDINIERADAAAEVLSVPAYYCVEDMFDSAEIDVVSVCTARELHVEPSLKSLERGAHVFCEKPLAMTTAEAKHVVEKARELGLQLGVDYNRRFAVPYLRAKAAVDAGQIGEVRYVAKRLSQGGVRETGKYDYLLELYVHSFDLLRHFAGEVTEMFCYHAGNRGEAFTTIACVFSFESGALATLTGTVEATYSQPIEQVEIMGTEGTIWVDNIVEGVRVYPHNGETHTVWRPSIFSRRDFHVCMGAHVQAFAKAIAEGKPAPVTGEDGLKSLQMVDAAIESFESGKPVKPY